MRGGRMRGKCWSKKRLRQRGDTGSPPQAGGVSDMGGAGEPFQRQVWWAGRQNMTVSARPAALPVLFMYCTTPDARHPVPGVGFTWIPRYRQKSGCRADRFRSFRQFRAESGLLQRVLLWRRGAGGFRALAVRAASRHLPDGSAVCRAGGFCDLAKTPSCRA